MSFPLFITSSEGFHYHEPVDGEAAEIIAGIAAKKAGTLVCPKIRECRGRCMSIVNLYPIGDSIGKKLHQALAIVEGNEPKEDFDEYSVGINCDHHEFCTPMDPIEIPNSLVKRDPLNCEQRVEEYLRILDARSGRTS